MKPSNPTVLRNGVNLVQLTPALPCGMAVDSDVNHLCGKPATVAWCDRVTAGMMTGSWQLVPVCEECARRALSLYGREPTIEAHLDMYELGKAA